ncbi:hypothetical protein A2U01_0058871, partial [Trifolium medium]|nr:hypothetical protein [Trifolium medium]
TKRGGSLVEEFLVLEDFECSGTVAPPSGRPTTAPASERERE